MYWTPPTKKNWRLYLDSYFISLCFFILLSSNLWVFICLSLPFWDLNGIVNLFYLLLMPFTIKSSFYEKNKKSFKNFQVLSQLWVLNIKIYPSNSKIYASAEILYPIIFLMDICKWDINIYLQIRSTDLRCMVSQISRMSILMLFVYCCFP